MSKEGFDLCEIFWEQWNNELSMRRLLNVLRNTQSYCTDNECLDDGTGGPNQSNPDHFLFLTLALVTALFLYYFRPRPQDSQINAKPDNNRNNSGGPPPGQSSSSE
ncbi:unnamed protein product [Phyllotreta striolata]|uniref:Small integral membrane protein 14 n=1 Tax=Phyllotreta striolata TaxID=444603 RepID=A0A9N9TWJ4_PHYSR|nr:unnamed protein product [Phyllotreta striolata]